MLSHEMGFRDDVAPVEAVENLLFWECIVIPTAKGHMARAHKIQSRRLPGGLFATNGKLILSAFAKSQIAPVALSHSVCLLI